MATYDVIVCGTGGVGSAAMWRLARRGVRVLGIDRFAPPHDHGSSHGQTRVIRQAYFEHPDYVPLLLETYRLWTELEHLTGTKLYHETGLLEVGPHDGVVVEGVVSAARQHHLQIEELAGAQIESRWPELRVPHPLTGVYEQRAGYLLVEECVEAQLRAASEAGAELESNVEVLESAIDRDAISLRTTKGQFSASAVVVTAGAWAAQLLRDLNLPLEVRRKSLFWFATPSAARASLASLPVFLYELPQGIFYGFPQLDDRGIKVAEHSGGIPVSDPAQLDREVDTTEQAAVSGFVRGHIPRVTTEITDHATCMYTMSPDEHFIVDSHPSYPQVALAAGLSGHGFKFTPILGEVLADLALDGSTDWPIGFLSLDRFGPSLPHAAAE